MALTLTHQPSTKQIIPKTFLDSRNITGDTTPGKLRLARAHILNPKYFGGDFINAQIIDMLHNEQITTEYPGDLKHGVYHFNATDWLLVAIMFIQMLAKAGLNKHGVLSEKVLPKDFSLINDMKVMTLLDPVKLTFEQKCQVLRK